MDWQRDAGDLVPAGLGRVDLADDKLAASSASVSAPGAPGKFCCGVPAACAIVADRSTPAVRITEVSFQYLVILQGTEAMAFFCVRNWCDGPDFQGRCVQLRGNGKSHQKWLLTPLLRSISIR